MLEVLWLQLCWGDFSVLLVRRLDNALMHLFVCKLESKDL